MTVLRQDPYDRVLPVNPAYAGAHLNRAAAHFELENYQAAILDYDQVITKDSSQAEPYYLRASSYLLLNQFQRAIDDFDLALELDSGHGSAHFSRAFAYLKFGKSLEAEPDINYLVEVLGVDEVIVRERFFRMLNPPSAADSIPSTNTP